MSAIAAQAAGYVQNLRRALGPREGAGATESYLARNAAGSFGLRVASLGLAFVCHLLLTLLGIGPTVFGRGGRESA